VSAYIRPCTFGLVVLCILACVSVPANANSVNVTGLGYLGGDSDAVGASAGTFSAFSAAPFGPSEVGGGVAGVPMTLSFSPSAYPGPGFTVVNIGNRFTDILTGGIIFTTGTFTVPASALVTGTFTTAVNVVGQVMAFQDLGGGKQGALMATLTFAGTGTVTLYLQDVGENQFVIIQAVGEFKNISGTLTVVPEPATLLLIGTGLVALGAVAGRDRGLLRRAPLRGNA
jgi:hypothetical protein